MVIINYSGLIKTM